MTAHKNGRPAARPEGAPAVSARVAQLSARVERLAHQVQGLAELVRGQNEMLQRLYLQQSAPAQAPPARMAAGGDPAGQPASDGYAGLVIRIRALIRSVVPAGSRVVVASKGDEELLLIEGRRAWHFPQVEGGVYAGHHPVDGRQAIDGLEALRERGAEYFVLPSTASWWLDHYPDFGAHLEARYRVAMRDPDTCLIFDLRPEEESR